jgi:hypothetical protein
MQSSQSTPLAGQKRWIFASFGLGFVVCFLFVLAGGYYLLVAQTEAYGYRALQESRAGRAQLVKVKDASDGRGAAFLLIDDSRHFFLMEKGDRLAIVGASGLHLGELQLLPGDLERATEHQTIPLPALP